jgi:DeoR family transcriptional regulator, glycerol-3-phosphate regulon repressor
MSLPIDQFVPTLKYMDANPRQLQLLDFVKRNGTASVEQLAELLNVTLQTVRRDITRLADEGLVARFHGGVRQPSSTIENLAYAQRENLNRAAKESIARAVASQIPHDSSLILNIGTTTEAVAKALLHHSGLRVITNNLNVANILSGNPQCEVIVTGGLVRSVDRGIIGEAAVDFIKQFRVDIAVIGASGIEIDGSLRDFDFREVKVAQAMIEHARQVWLAADSSKFNRHAMVELAQLKQIDRLFTEKEPPDPFPQLLEEAQVRVEIVPPKTD